MKKKDVNRLIKKQYNWLSSHKSPRHVLRYPTKETGDVTGTIHYVGSSTDPLSIFAFENASKYVHQDVGLSDEINILPILKDLERDGIIQNLKVKYKGKHVRRFTFDYNDQNKHLVEFGGEHYGDATKYVPEDSRDGLEAILMKGVGGAIDLSRLSLVNLLPHLKIGGRIIDTVKPSNLYNFEGKEFTMEKAKRLDNRGKIAGLERIDTKDNYHHYIKKNHKTKDQIERDLNFSHKQYEEKRRDRREDMVNITPSGKLVREVRVGVEEGKV